MGFVRSALAFGPSDNVVGVVEDQVVVALDQIAQQGRRVGDRVYLDHYVFLLEKAFFHRSDDRRVAVEQSDLDQIFSHKFTGNSVNRVANTPFNSFIGDCSAGTYPILAAACQYVQAKRAPGGRGRLV